MRCEPARTARARGLTLAELLVAVALLAIVVAVALPGFSAGDAKALDTAVDETASALRWARAEAMRTGANVGVSFDTTAERIGVGTYSSAASSVAATHPVDKRTYVIDMANRPVGGAVDLASAAFLPGPRTLVVFDGNGNPLVYDAGGTATVALTSGSVVIAYNGVQATIAIDASGRVTTP